MFESTRGSKSSSSKSTTSTSRNVSTDTRSSRGQHSSYSRSRSNSNQDQHPNPERWWHHRRRGFYIGLWWTAIQTLMWIAIGIYDVEVIKALGIVVGWCYAISATLIVAYYGNNAIESFSSRGINRR